MIDAMAILDVMNPIFGNTALTALVAFLIYVILLIPFTKILGIIVLRLTRKTKTKADDFLAKRLYKWVFYFLLFIGLRFAIRYSNIFVDVVIFQKRIKI